jgi:hypothetical protein
MDDDLDPLVIPELANTDYDKSQDGNDLYALEYDEVFLPDGSRLLGSSVLDDLFLSPSGPTIPTDSVEDTQ